MYKAHVSTMQKLLLVAILILDKPFARIYLNPSCIYILSLKKDIVLNKVLDVIDYCKSPMCPINLQASPRLGLHLYICSSI